MRTHVFVFLLRNKWLVVASLDRIRIIGKEEWKVNGLILDISSNSTLIICLVSIDVDKREI